MGSVKHTAGRTLLLERSSNGKGPSTTLCFVTEQLPIIQCVDVFLRVLQKGERRRVWDGCILSEFAAVAGGHNFRRHRTDRYRHRYYRKGKYVPEKIGEIACVGCGRCITACTANIANPVEVYNRLVHERE